MWFHTGLHALYDPAFTWIWDIQGSDFIEYKIIGQTCPERRKETMLTESMKTAFSTAVDSIKEDVTGMIVVALPAGLAIMGIRLAVRLGVSFFRTIAG